MEITRLRVEEGFFNALDLRFESGLNVLVGGRGVGKTSIIELLRFGLGVSNLSDIDARESKTHALSILHSTGRVIIDVNVNGQLLTISRGASEDVPSNISLLPKPIIFSQKEVETVSMNAEGKLNLIDSFLLNTPNTKSEQEIKSAEIRSLFASLLQVQRELDEAVDRTSKKSELKKQETALLLEQKEYESKNLSISSSQNAYSEIEQQLNIIELSLSKSAYLQSLVYEKLDRLNSFYAGSIDTSHSGSLDPEVNEIFRRIDILNSEEKRALDSLIGNSNNLISHINVVNSNLYHKKSKLENEARNYRNEISNITESAGRVLSNLSQVRKQLSSISSWEEVVEGKRAKLKDLYEKIQLRLNELSNIRHIKLTQRQEVVKTLNSSLNPEIRIDIEPSKNQTKYTEELKFALKGSGLRYNEIIDDITSMVPPQWLFYYVFGAKYEEFSQMVGIPLDRATRLLAYLQGTDLSSVLTAKIDDSVNFYLLDKGSYKRVEELSIGQRCTVALSVILENKNKILIVDQPEDHLDNEFIAKTLIKSLIKRASNSQTILSSHNANIPVLGNAKMVINLDSNGRKGFIKCAGSLESENVKTAIESIMEGGKSAFKQRADFYLGI